MQFIKVPLDFSSWEWFDSKDTVYVYLWLRLKAVWCETRYHGIELKRGQLVATYPEIAQNCAVSIRQARTALDRLKSTGKLTVKVMPKFSVITLLDYDCNEENDSQIDRQTTGKRQAKGQSNDSPTLLNTDIQNTEVQIYAHSRGGGGADENFEKFWAAYPKKTAKQAALKAWNKLKPNEELVKTILAALDVQKKSEQWTKDKGQFIPYPATWLNGRRWEDEREEKSNGNTNNETMRNRTEEYWLQGFKLD